MNKPQETEQSIDLTEYYYIILKHKWTIIFSLLIMVGLVAFFNALATPVYEGTATLIVDKEGSKSPVTGERLEYQSGQSESLTFFSHFELITSHPVMKQMVDNLQLTDKKFERKKTFENLYPLQKFLSLFKANVRLIMDHIFGKKQQTAPPSDKTEQLIKSIQKNVIKIKHIEDTRLVRITALTPFPSLSKDIADGVAQAYIDYNLSNRLKTSKNTITYLTNHLYETQKNLEDAEQQFLKFKQESKLISMDESQRTITQKITEFTDAYIQARNRRLELDLKLKKIQGASKSKNGIRHLRSLIDNELISTLYSQLVNLEVERSRLRKVYKSKHPKIIQITTQLSNIRNKLNQEIKKELDSLKAERSVLQARERVLQETMKDFKEESLEINKSEFQYNILKRNVQMNQNLYDTLLSRLKETDLSGNIDVSNIRITEKAILANKPVRPKKVLNLTLGVIFGLMIGIGFSFMWEFMDRSVSTEDDVKKYLGIPVLAIVPQIAVPKKFDKFSDIKDNKPS